MPERPNNQQDATAFREAISQWQLAARTEVKRASSLPSSMFDACDPMLEASLAESVERMLNCLHEPCADKLKSDEVPEQRTEQVSPDELRELPQLIGKVDDDLDIDTGLRAEYLTLLIDTCVTGDEPTRAAAAQLLRRDFEVTTSADLDATAAALQTCLHELLPVSQPTAEQAEQLADLCQRIAASALVQVQDREAGGEA